MLNPSYRFKLLARRVAAAAASGHATMALPARRRLPSAMPSLSGASWHPGGPRLPPASTPEPSRSVRKGDLVKVQHDRGIRRKCMPAAQPRALGRSDIEPVPDQYAGSPVHMTKMLQRHRHLGKLRYPEQLFVRCQRRYLPDVFAELRRQAGRGFIDAAGPPEHVSKNNTRFSAHVPVELGRPVPARAPRETGLVVPHHRMVRPKDLRVRPEGRHRHHLDHFPHAG